MPQILFPFSILILNLSCGCNHQFEFFIFLILKENADFFAISFFLRKSFFSLDSYVFLTLFSLYSIVSIKQFRLSSSAWLKEMSCFDLKTAERARFSFFVFLFFFFLLFFIKGIIITLLVVFRTCPLVRDWGGIVHGLVFCPSVSVSPGPTWSIVHPTWLKKENKARCVPKIGRRLMGRGRDTQKADSKGVLNF